MTPHDARTVLLLVVVSWVAVVGLVRLATWIFGGKP